MKEWLFLIGAIVLETFATCSSKCPTCLPILVLR